MHNLNRSRALRRIAIPVTVAGLTVTSFAALRVSPTVAATYSDYRAREQDYQACAEGLLGSGIAAADAAEACAGALHPRDLSICVTEIDDETSIASSDALASCRRVRRPVDLSTCVVAIEDRSTDGTELLSVLTNCRRSLLPIRFANCVVGLRDEIDFSTTEAMSDCIAASSRPRETSPSFVPIEQGIPSTPSRINPTEPAPQ